MVEVRNSTSFELYLITKSPFQSLRTTVYSKRDIQSNNLTTFSDVTSEH